MELNLCYVVGSTLLYMNKLSLEDLQKICSKLSEKGYIIDSSNENIFAIIKEWNDFFMLDLDNNIVLIDNTIENKYVVELIFNDILDMVVRKDILNSTLYRNKEKCKIIKYCNWKSDL